MAKPSTCPICNEKPPRRGKDTRWCVDCFKDAGRPKKACQQCGADKPADTFARVCMECQRQRARERHVEKTYGLSAEEYDALLEYQNGRCAICGNRPRTQRLAVDHDHRTGVVRGLLCKRCNHDLLGGGHDSLEILRNAVAYLECPPVVKLKGNLDAS